LPHELLYGTPGACGGAHVTVFPSPVDHTTSAGVATTVAVTPAADAVAVKFCHAPALRYR
jgi:hypothetical protein